MRGTDSSMNVSSRRARRVAAWPIARLAISCNASRCSSVKTFSGIQPVLLEDRHEGLGGHGLGDERGGAEGAYAFLSQRLDVRRDDDHERVQVLVLERFEYLVARHVGHRQVEKHHRSLAGAIQRERFAAVRRIFDFDIPVGRQGFRKNLAGKQGIVGDHNRQRHGSVTGKRSFLCRVNGGSCLFFSGARTSTGCDAIGGARADWPGPVLGRGSRAQCAKFAHLVAPGLRGRLCHRSDAGFSEETVRKATRQISGDQTKIISLSCLRGTLHTYSSEKCVKYSFVYVCASEFVAVCVRGRPRWRTGSIGGRRPLPGLAAAADPSRL